MAIYVILTVYGKEIPSQTVLAMLNYQYLRKPRNNPLCPRRNLWDYGNHA